jgi:hypothetical protein
MRITSNGSAAVHKASAQGQVPARVSVPEPEQAPVLAVEPEPEQAPVLAVEPEPEQAPVLAVEPAQALAPAVEPVAAKVSLQVEARGLASRPVPVSDQVCSECLGPGTVSSTEQARARVSPRGRKVRPVGPRDPAMALAVSLPYPVGALAFLRQLALELVLMRHDKPYAGQSADRWLAERLSLPGPAVVPDWRAWHSVVVRKEPELTAALPW